MLIPLENIKAVYLAITQAALEQDGNGCTIYIFVSNDADSLTSLKIFTSLLRADEIQYTAIPVFSNPQVIDELDKLEDAKYAKSLIFINCGGVIDMTNMWFNEKADVRCYLMDYHRPYNHLNINEDKQKVCIIHDGCKSFDECPSKEDDALFQQLCAYGEESDESDNFSDEEEAQQELDELEGRDMEDEEGEPRPREPKEADSGKLKRQTRQKFNNYYRGVFYGKSTSSVFYELAHQLNRESKDILWFWIVGLSDLVVHCRSDQFDYNEEIEKCNEEVLRIQPTDDNQAYVERKAELKDLYGTKREQEREVKNQDDEKYQSTDFFSVVVRETENREIGTISIEQELKLMLLRHWTLHDSIYNSNYMVTKLQLWKEQNQRRFKDFLAKIGVPLDQANQKFQYMDAELRKQLKRRILDKTMEFGLDKILQSSYVRQVSENVQVSATDMAYAISSLLEAPSGLNILNEQEIRTNQKTGKGEKVVQQQRILEEMEQQQALANTLSQLSDNFWQAYDALDTVNSFPLLQKGISLAKEMQMALVRVGTSLIERKEVKVAQAFRYVMLENDYLSDIKLFQFPLALQKLGLFIMEAYQSERRKAKDRPLVISVKNSKSGMTLVLAITGHHKENVNRNDFGQRFVFAAQKVGVQAKHESFAAGMVEIRNQDWRAFMEELSNL